MGGGMGHHGRLVVHAFHNFSGFLVNDQCNRICLFLNKFFAFSKSFACHPVPFEGHSSMYVLSVLYVPVLFCQGHL